MSGSGGDIMVKQLPERQDLFIDKGIHAIPVGVYEKIQELIDAVNSLEMDHGFKVNLAVRGLSDPVMFEYGP